MVMERQLRKKQWNVYITHKHVHCMFNAKAIVSNSHMQWTLQSMRPLQLVLLAFHLELRSQVAHIVKVTLKKMWMKTDFQLFLHDERRVKKMNPKAVLILDTQEAHSEKGTLKMIRPKRDPQLSLHD